MGPVWYLLRSGKPLWLRLLWASVIEMTRGFFLSIGSGR